MSGSHHAPPLIRKQEITGVILAGGRGRRMGGLDKGLYPFADKPLIEWVIAALAPQVHRLLINANRSLDLYDAYGVPVVKDAVAGYPGPLVGIMSAMEVAATPWIAVVPCDTPLVPRDLVARLGDALIGQGAEVAIAHDGQRAQPLHALLPVALAAVLKRFIASGERKVEDWYAGRRCAMADLRDHAEGFANINSPADAALLSTRLSSG